MIKTILVSLKNVQLTDMDMLTGGINCFANRIKEKINNENISSRSIPSNKTAVMTITFHTKNLARAEQLMNTLRRLKDVYSVRRNLSSSAKEK